MPSQDQCPRGYFEDDDHADDKRRRKTTKKVLAVIFVAAAGTLGSLWLYSAEPEIPQENIVPVMTPEF